MIGISVVLILLGLVFASLYFITKTHKNYEKRNPQSDYMVRSVINYSIISIFAILLILYKDTIFITRESIIPDFKTIVLYILVIDCVYYWIHRTTHRIPYLRKELHETHHDVFHLLPMDILNETVLEYCMYMFATNIAPLFLIPITFVEYFTVFILIFIHSVYCHSESEKSFFLPLFIDSTYHRYHHQIGKGNYSAFLSIWDDFMKTRIPAPSAPPTASQTAPLTTPQTADNSNRKKEGLKQELSTNDNTKSEKNSS